MNRISTHTSLWSMGLQMDLFSFSFYTSVTERHGSVLIKHLFMIDKLFYEL